jgi:heme/copper-type cytochrome/quinol oxidase subunit 4
MKARMTQIQIWRFVMKLILSVALTLCAVAALLAQSRSPIFSIMKRPEVMHYLKSASAASLMS